MPLWANTDQASSAPRNKFQVAGQKANGQVLFGNVTVGAVNAKMATGVFGVDVAEARVEKGVAHPGWVLVRQGTGPVRDLTVAVAGTGYNNSDVGTISGGASNATFSIVTNGAGAIQSAALVTVGGGFANVDALTVGIANSTGGATGGSGATISVTLGGRAGRVHYETLVAMGSIQSDAEDTVFPDA